MEGKEEVDTDDDEGEIDPTPGRTGTRARRSRYNTAPQQEAEKEEASIEEYDDEEEEPTHNNYAV